MAFDFGAFIAGASQGAATAIETRNKEIRNVTLREFDRLQKEAGEQEEKLRTKRDEMKATAEVLSSYRGANNVGFTPSQIVGLLQNPAVAKRVTEQLKNNEDGLSQIDFSKLYTVTKGNSDITPEEYIKQTTAIPISVVEEPQKVVRGAFGLESPAYAQAQAEFEASSGKSIKELRAFAKGPMQAEGKVEGIADFSQFKKPDSLALVTGKLRDNIANGEDLNSQKNKTLLAQLRANAVIEGMFDKGEGSDKPRTAAQINSVFNTSLRVALDPFIVKGVVRFDPNANDYVPISGDAESINSFMEQKTKVIQAQARALGILDKDNNITGGRNAMDALLPYAEIEGNKVVGWKRPASPTPAPAAPAAPASTESAKPAATNQEVLPLPKTKDGKLDGTQLKAGRSYKAADGSVKIWNGTGWQ
jgi:hypothetical protein